MRILVTGAAGFIGSHVVRKLIEKGHAVRAVIRSDVRKEQLRDCLDRLDVVSLDLGDTSRVQSVVADLRPECAIHLAWYAKHQRYWTAPENLECVQWSLSLARSLAEAGCKRLVVAGTCAEYDWRYGVASEGITPCHPQTLYGASKHALYLILERFCRSAKMDLAWARFFLLYGPHEHPDRLVPHVIQSLLQGRKPKCTSGAQIRDFLHVEDAASALVALAESYVLGAVNIGSGLPISVRDVATRLAHLADRPGEVEFGALPTDAQEPHFLVPDVRRLTQEVGWKPSRTLDAGLSQALAWWKERLSRVSTP